MLSRPTPSIPLSLSLPPHPLRPDALVLPGAKKRAPKEEADEPPPDPHAHPSKSQLRKLRKVEEIKKKRDERASVLETLHTSALSDEHLKMMRPISQRGQKETKKQK